MVFAKRGKDHVAMPRLQAVEDNFDISFSAAQKFLDGTVFLGEAIPEFGPGFRSDQMAAFLG